MFCFKKNHSRKAFHRKTSTPIKNPIFSEVEKTFKEEFTIFITRANAFDLLMF